MRDWLCDLIEEVREFASELVGIAVYSLCFIAFIAWVFVCIRIVIWLGGLILV